MAEYPTDDKPTLRVPERPCALVNTSSGERSAAIFVSGQLKKHFGADNVFDLFPEKGKPPAIEQAKAFVQEKKPDLLVVAGGDGTVSLGLDIVDAIRAQGKIDANIAPIAVIPMGTGNDLSRSLGFGGGYRRPTTKAEAHFEKLMRKLQKATPCLIDRFNLSIHLLSSAEIQELGSAVVNGHRPQSASSTADTSSGKERSGDSQAEDHSPDSAANMRHQQDVEGRRSFSSSSPGQEAPANASTIETSSPDVTKVFTNYFSIGFDAKVAKQFGDFRDKNPEMCTSRVANKMWYGCFGCKAMVSSRTLPKKHISLTMDGKPVKVPSSMKAIVVSNMITYAGGNVLWADGHHRFDKPEVNDGQAEVVALEGVWHMVGVGTQTRSAHKLGQGASIVLYAPADFTMQYDGEPIAAMGRSSQRVKVVIKLRSQSLGMRMPKGAGAPADGDDDGDDGNDAGETLHTEVEDT